MLFWWEFWLRIRRLQVGDVRKEFTGNKHITMGEWRQEVLHEVEGFSIGELGDIMKESLKVVTFTSVLGANPCVLQH